MFVSIPAIVLLVSQGRNSNWCWATNGRNTLTDSHMCKTGIHRMQRRQAQAQLPCRHTGLARHKEETQGMLDNDRGKCPPAKKRSKEKAETRKLTHATSGRGSALNETGRRSARETGLDGAKRQWICSHDELGLDSVGTSSDCGR